MPEYAPAFDGAILPKNTTPLTESAVTDALVGTTVGASAGSATSKSKTRIKHPPLGAGGGKMELESNTLINRNSAAADVTALKTKFTKKNPSFTFPRDLSGNGGGSFTRS